MFGLGGMEVVILLVIGLLLFGKQLPTLARSVGKSLVEFRKEIGGLSDEMRGHS